MKNHSIIVNFNQKPAYCIHIEDNFKQLPSYLSELQIKNRKLMVISDSNVSQYYLEECKNILKPHCKEVYEFVFLAGEAQKNLNTVEACYEKLIHAQFDRNDVLIALGGGVVGDMTGFIAATYLRGIRFVQVPTSLLAMVDSSIGGKTGVDFKSYKNMVGAFHQPKLVYMNLASLETLPEREFMSGMSEIIKHGLIKDKAYFEWLNHNSAAILRKDYDVLCQMIMTSCNIKREVVENDPYEKKDRALLNLGHTIGHSVEKLMDFKLLHGECVSIGCICATYISYLRGFLSKEEYQAVIDCFDAFKQPIQINGLSIDEIIAVTKHDKKMDGNLIKFILLHQLGNAFIDTTITDQELEKAILEVSKK